MKALGILLSSLLAAELLSTGVFAVNAAAAPVSFEGKNVVTGAITQVSAGTKGVAVVFLSSRCPCSAAHEPVLKDIYLQFQNKGFQFVGVHSNADEPASETKEHFRRAALPFPVIQDTGSALANRFGALRTPHVFVLSSEGKTLYAGGVDDQRDAKGTSKSSERDYLRNALTEISEGKEPKHTQTKAIGCVIER